MCFVYLEIKEEKLELSKKLSHFAGLGHMFDTVSAFFQERVGASPQHGHQQETQHFHC